MRLMFKKINLIQDFHFDHFSFGLGVEGLKNINQRDIIYKPELKNDFL